MMFKSKLDLKSELAIINMLVDSSDITNEQFDKINSASEEIGKSKLETAIELNLTDEDKILKVLANTYHLEIVDLSSKEPDIKLKEILDSRFAEENQIAPFEITGNNLKVCIPDGSKLSMIKTLQAMTRMDVEIFASSISGISKFLDRLKNTAKDEKKVDMKDAKLERKKSVQDEVIDVDDNVIEFTNKCISNALELGASDIHMECFRESAQIRYRVDGILYIKYTVRGT